MVVYRLEANKVFLNLYSYQCFIHVSAFPCRNPVPKSRPQFGQITQLFAGNCSYLLGWSNEDRKIVDQDAAKLGAPLESSNSLYYDLQVTYSH